MAELQPTTFNKVPSEVLFNFHIKSGDNTTAAYLFKSWDVDSFPSQNNSSLLNADEITVTRNSPDEVTPRSDDARLIVGDSISTWGSGSRNQVRLFLDGFLIFDGWVNAENGMPSTDLSGTWTQSW